MENVDIIVLLWLLGASFVAGVIDAMAGGGGLLSLPALLSVGVDPVSAIATQKFQGIFSSLSSTIHFWREGRIKLEKFIVPAIAAFAGSIFGAIIVSSINTEYLKIIVPVLLITIALWVLLSPKLGEISREARISPVLFGLTAIPLIGFYDGFFGPGTGSFFALSMVSLLGLTLQEATIRTKFFNFMSNAGGLLFFIFSGHVIWLYGLVMSIGSVTGGYVGAHLVLKHGTKLIKPILVFISIAVSIKLLWQQGLITALLDFLQL
jgi:hypothetical protein